MLRLALNSKAASKYNRAGDLTAAAAANPAKPRYSVDVLLYCILFLCSREKIYLKSSLETYPYLSTGWYLLS